MLYNIRNCGYNSDVINDFIASYITKKSNDITSILNNESKWIKKKVRLSRYESIFVKQHFAWPRIIYLSLFYAECNFDYDICVRTFAGS